MLISFSHPFTEDMDLIPDKRSVNEEPETAGGPGIAVPAARRAAIWRAFAAVKPLPALVVAAAAAVRLFRLDHTSLWYDELYTVWSSRLPLRYMVREVMASGHPPLYYLLGHVWFALGQSDTWLRLLSWGAGTGTVALVYLAGSELLSRRAAIWAAALAALSPVLIWYSRDATSYSTVAFLATLSFYFLIRGARRGGWRNWCGYVAATAAVSLTYYFSPVLIVAGWPAYWLLRDRDRSDWRWWLGSQTALIAAALALMFAAGSGTAENWLTLTSPGLNNLFTGFIEAPLTLIGGPRPANDLNYKGAALGLSFTWMAVLVLALSALALTLAIGPAAMRRRLGGRSTAALAVYSFLLIGAPMLLEAIIDRVPTARFYLWGTPVFLLLAGAVLAAAPRKTALALGGAALAVSAAFTFYQLAWTDDLTGDWRAVMATISQNRRPGDEILCFPLHQCAVAVSHYLPDPPPLLGGFPLIDAPAVYGMGRAYYWTGYISGYYTGMGKGTPLAGAAIGIWVDNLLKGANRVWLIDSDSDPVMPQIKGDLARNWREAARWNFYGQPLRLYVRAHG